MNRHEIVNVEGHRYAVRLEPQPEGGFTVTLPALPEVVTEGDTLAEALAMAKDAIRQRSRVAAKFQVNFDLIS